MLIVDYFLDDVIVVVLLIGGGGFIIEIDLVKYYLFFIMI